MNNLKKFNDHTRLTDLETIMDNWSFDFEHKEQSGLK